MENPEEILGEQNKIKPISWPPILSSQTTLKVTDKIYNDFACWFGTMYIYIPSPAYQEVCINHRAKYQYQ